MRAIRDAGLRLRGTFGRLRSVPVMMRGRSIGMSADFDLKATTDRVMDGLRDAAAEYARNGNANLEALLKKSVTVDGIVLPYYWGFKIEELLSPIGIAHYYRQLYFNRVEGVGPLEEAFTIAPLETFEIVYETTRRQIHEEILEQGLEIVSEAATEEKNLDEVSDKVSSMVQQDNSASMSANASGGIGVWSVGASATASYAVSQQSSREGATRRLTEMTKRASERITKSFTLRRRDTTEVTTTNMTRRVIRNESNAPVSYGLRRVLRRVAVKVQDLGPRLVWQLYLRNPGEGLALSKFIHFLESQPVSVPEIPPGVPPKPIGGTDVGTVQTTIGMWSTPTGGIPFVAVVVKAGPDRVVQAIRIDTITDLEGGGKDDEAPSPINDAVLDTTEDPTTNTFTAYIAVNPGDSQGVQVGYTYTYEPSQAALDAWEAIRKEAVDKLSQEALAAQFERDKALITQRSKIKARPANDLRQEERYEIMNRMVSHLFGRVDNPTDPAPLEIEYFHRYFDIDGIFIQTHPSWWRPRFVGGGVGLQRNPYEVTAESEPAPLGSSLGWLIQLDGDRRRNEFLNSPWSRICLPMRPGREAEAVGWLARHVEGEIGYDPAKDPLKSLLKEIKDQRDREDALGIDGPEYVTVDSTPGAPANPASPEDVYPIVDEFEVTMPTDGFVYDELVVRP